MVGIMVVDAKDQQQVLKNQGIPYASKIITKNEKSYVFIATTYGIGPEASPQTQELAKTVFNQMIETFTLTTDN